MRFTSYALVWGASVLEALAAYNFTPDQTGLALDKYVASLPLQYDLPASQISQANVSNSYWASSYIQGSNNHQYVVISHFLSIEAAGISVRRASILDITDPTVYAQFSTIAGVPVQSGPGVNVQFDDYGFVSTTTNPVGPIRYYSTNSAVRFDLTFLLTSPVILNGGLGSFKWENTTANQWSMPSGTTTGSLTINNSTIQVNPSKSFTWYDRQFQPGGASEWTWFALHVSDPVTPATKRYSTWFTPDGLGSVQGFATFRDERGVQQVVAATLTTRASSWTSPYSGTKYATAWDVNLADGTSFEISVTRDDQELHDPLALQATYEGLVSVKGKNPLGLPVVGYGIVEIQPPVSI